MYSFCLLWCYLVSHQKQMWPCVLGVPQQASVPSARLPSVPCPCLVMGVGSDTAWLLVFLLPQREISGRCSLRCA